jgi:hypothetical protein
MKKAETSLFRPSSGLGVQAISIQDQAGAMRCLEDHQWSHPGFDSDCDASDRSSRIASSWYQLPLQMVSFTCGVVWEDVSP